MRRYLIAGSVSLLPLLGGCATTGGQDMMNTVYNTNRIVRNLEQNLTPTVNKLNQTTADLGARVDASEQETSRMAQQLESTTALLQQIQQQLDEMQRVVYRNAGMTPPRSTTSAAPGFQVGPIVQDAAPDGSAPAPVPGTGPSPAMPDTAPVGGGAPIGPTTVPIPVGPTSGAAPDPDSILDNPAPTAVAAAPTPPPVADTPPPPPPPPPAGNEGEAASGEAGQDLYKKAGAEFYAGNYDKARDLYDQYLQQYPNAKDTPNAQFWKGEAQLKLNQYQNAIQDFEQLRKGYPTNSKVPYSMYEQAEAHLKLGQTNEAVQLLKQLIDEWPMTRPAAKAKADLEKRGIQ